MIDPFKAEHAAIMSVLRAWSGAPISTYVLGRLVDHLGKHFIHEERLMREGCFPAPMRDQHMEDHLLIQNLFMHHLPGLLSGNISEEELELMVERLDLHIGSEDARLIKYLNFYHPEVLDDDAEANGR